VFAAADHAPGNVAPGTSAQRVADLALAHGVATALRGSALFLALGLVVVLTVMWRPAAAAEEATASALVAATALDD
jgi:hypothetical protein